MDSINKSLEENELNKQDKFDLIEKGKALPIGTIKKRPNGNFIKTAQGWKYHSSHKSTGSQGGVSEDKQHIGDMGGADKLSAAKKLGIKNPEQYSPAQLNKLMISANVDKEFAKFKEKSSFEDGKKYVHKDLPGREFTYDAKSGKFYEGDRKGVKSDLVASGLKSGIKPSSEKKPEKTSPTNKLLRSDSLSSSEYQKAKKLKGFDSSNYKWDSRTELYEKQSKSSEKKSKKYDRAEFKSVPVKKGDRFLYEFSNGGAHVGITKVDGDSAEFQQLDFMNETSGSKYKNSLSHMQRHKDKWESRQHDKKEDHKEKVHNLSEKIGISKLKGGSLTDVKAAKELGGALKRLQDWANQFNTGDKKVGGQYYGSTALFSAQSGTALQFDINNVHRAGRYGFDRMYAIQGKIGGALSVDDSRVIKDGLTQILEKYPYKSNLGDSYIADTDGTNWDSVMIVAPHKDNKYTPIGKEIIDAINQK